MGKKVGLLVIISMVLLSLNLISAINLDISTEAISNKVITDINEPAVFDLTIRNLGATQEFEIYSLIGVDINPKSKQIIPSGETRIVRITAMPQDALKSNKGFMTFEYRIKDEANQIQKQTLTINIIELKDVFSINPEIINPTSEKTKVIIENQANLEFDNTNVKINSAFFNLEQTLSFSKLETKEIEVNLDKEKIKPLDAGNYLLNTEIKFQSTTAEIESFIKFLEQENIESSEITEGVIIKRHEISKNNLGNTRKTVKITAEKNILSSLFTTTNIAPTKTELNGFTKKYIWEKEIIPNQELKIIIKTNWFFPIIVILLIIGLYMVIKKSVETDLILRKKVTFVKTKGGQFALKVTLKLKSKRFLERINLIDKLPPLVKLYERFGAIEPDKIDTQNKRIEYNIQSLNEGEERIFSYIIYSKIGIVGRFELPSAKAVYEKEGKIKRTESNRSFFINEPKG
tara:strand:- start:1628 stop:3007 length:1380 start_codon:yes stop_codon:yes gene_type:complete